MDTAVVDPNAPQQVSLPSIWKRMWRWARLRYQRRQLQQTAYERRMRPTTRLLLVILFAASAISLAIVLFSTIYIFDHSVNDVKEHVLREVNLLRFGLELFGYTKPRERYVSQMQQLSSLLGVVAEDLGYQGNKAILKEELTFQQKLFSRLLDGWFVHDATSRAARNAQLLRGCVQFLARTEDQSTAIAFMDQLNPTLPAGHEVVLSHQNNSTHVAEYTTKLRYRSQCNNVACAQNGTVDALSLCALNRTTGTAFGVDYRPQPVVAGYTYVVGEGMGLVFAMERSVLEDGFADPAAATVNDVNLPSANQTTNFTMDAHEFVLAKRDSTTGKMLVLTTELTCNATCMEQANLDSGVLTLALNGSNGTVDAQGFSGSDTIVAYGPMSMSGFALAAQAQESDFQAGLFDSLADTLDALNREFNNTKEVQLAVADNSSTNGFRFLTTFTHTCNGTCNAPGTSPYMALAVTNCTGGVSSRALDYRSAEVIVGYSCIPSLLAGIAVKVDEQQIVDNGIQMVSSILTYETDTRFATSTYEMYAAKLKSGVTVAHTRDDYERINARKLERDCPGMVCTGPTTFLIAALSGQEGVMKGIDYRNREVYGAYTYVPSFKVGLVVKVDTSEAEADSIHTALELAGCCVAALIASMLVLAWLTGKQLGAMDQAWDEGKRAIEREKQQFRSVIEAMYPDQVAQRLLVGETHIAYHVPAATVFFCDIYEFTTASNAITPEELIQFMGYTFGTMDAAAEIYNVHKVKTMGDAYLGVAGLPGSESPSGNTALDVLTFASCCAQVFSTRYLHPESAEVLGTVAKALFGRRDPPKKPKDNGEASTSPVHNTSPSHIQYANPSMPNGAVLDPETPGVQCVMRYGVASGPITAGVLQGKTPLFDIWGKTVNLASRMESTGVPGRVQVSESVFQSVVSVKDQPFTFDPRHRVSCKGFGSVNAYFVSSCTLPPPKSLLRSCGIQPNLGRFFFDNAVPGFKSSSKTGSSGHNSTVDRNSSGGTSPRSSAASGLGGSLHR
eukprot:GGOE01035876.1.p1 GENE.GGOE01035876.1~~GGOE01035876.1.p1  ORF type:complete len:1162 (-),score=411.87 GGOE01035876.1:1521-4565(-)